LTSVVLMTLAVISLSAQDEPPGKTGTSKASEELRKLEKEFKAATNAFFGVRNELAKQFQATKDDAKRKELKKKLDAWKDRFMEDRPMTKFGPRLLEFAEKNTKDPAGVEALALLLREEFRFSDGVKDMGTLWQRAIVILQREYVTVPGVKPLLPLLAHSNDAASEKFVRAVLEKNPDRLTRARAAQALLNANERAVAIADQFEKDEGFRKKVEPQLGKEVVEKYIAKGKKARQEVKELRALLERKYADVLPDLSIGKKAPDVKCQDLEGKEVKLSDYRGKVVVLDFWTTSCVPCRAMLPHQRELVKELKGKPFAFISINADKNKETPKKFLEKEPMPWTHWWNGRVETGMAATWNVEYVPTIYVIDAKGIIRHKDLQGEFPAKKLREAVMALLEEVGEKK
jgi:thiol-disulfide isomerase/thioredoxin